MQVCEILEKLGLTFLTTDVITQRYNARMHTEKKTGKKLKQLKSEVFNLTVEI